MQVALNTGLVSNSPNMPARPKSRRRSSIRRELDALFLVQTSAMTWEILVFVLNEEGVCPNLYEQKLRHARQTPDDHHFQKAVEAAKAASKVLLSDNGDEMRQLSTALDTSDELLYSSYHTMAQSAIGSEVRWGRIVALMTFTGIMAAHLVQVNEVDKVESLLGWERTFVCENCYDWIQSCGGWESICAVLRTHSTGHHPEVGRTAISTSRDKVSWWLAPIAVGAAGLAIVGALLSK